MLKFDWSKPLEKIKQWQNRFVKVGLCTATFGTRQAAKNNNLNTR